VRTYLERDLQDLATISSLPDFRRLMQAACLRLGQLLNQTELGRDARVARAELGYWRTTIGEEVDVVIEAGGKLLPIEVKASASQRLADCAHLRSFRAEYGNKARAGLLLHTGSSVEWLTPDVLAAPWWRVI
jgi:predicted AAA+ superfamily ATPase